MKKLLTTILILVCLASSALATKLIPNGSTSQSITVVITDANGDPNTTPATIADLDIYCQKDGAGAMSTKIDLVALADTQTSWTSGRAIHQGQGLYRIDIPDANLSDGIGTLLTYLIVDAAGSNRAVYYEVQLTDPVTPSDANDYVTARLGDILTDTATTIPGQISDGNDLLTARLDAILLDTGTTLPGTLSDSNDFVSTRLDAILLDTGTTLPALINDVNDVIIGNIISSAPSAAAIADAVLDEVMSGHTTVGTLAAYVRSAAYDNRRN